MFVSGRGCGGSCRGGTVKWLCNGTAVRDCSTLNYTSTGISMYEQTLKMLLMLCCFTSTVNIRGHVWTVS